MKCCGYFLFSGWVKELTNLFRAAKQGSSQQRFLQSKNRPWSREWAKNFGHRISGRSFVKRSVPLYIVWSYNKAEKGKLTKKTVLERGLFLLLGWVKEFGWKWPNSHRFWRADFCPDFRKRLANTSSIHCGFFVVMTKIRSVKTARTRHREIFGKFFPFETQAGWRPPRRKERK